MDKFNAARRKFIDAAEQFLSAQDCKPDDRRFSDFAAATFIKGGEWVRAGDIYMKEHEFKKAGSTYLVPKQYSLAASAFAQCSIFLLFTKNMRIL